MKVDIREIRKARRELAQYLPETPLMLNASLSETFGCEVYLKLETVQPVGSFKIRGATYRISQLTPKQRKAGVICASAGNHAQGMAWGARLLGVKALVVMPTNAALTKVQNTRALGAEVILEGASYSESFAIAAKLAKKTGRTLIHAFEDPHVIAGQGTLGLEILEQLPEVDAIIGSIGGGGMMAGVGLAIEGAGKEVRLIGCQSEGAPSMIKSLRAGRAVELPSVNTFADGIAVRVASEPVRKILHRVVHEIHAISDDEIASAVLTLMERAKIVTEGSAAIALATLQKVKAKLKRKKVVLIMCGGNIDVNVLGRIIDRGLIRAGRRLRVNVWISDRPGSLARLTAAIAEKGANILQAIHDRNELSTTIDQTEVALTLETKGAEHSKELIQLLRDQAERVELL